MHPENREAILTEEKKRLARNNFEEWKIKTNNMLPSAKEAWDYQEKFIRDLESKVVIASELIKRERKVLEELKAFVEENIKLIDKLERENAELKKGNDFYSKEG